MRLKKPHKSALKADPTRDYLWGSSGVGQLRLPFGLRTAAPWRPNLIRN